MSGHITARHSVGQARPGTATPGFSEGCVIYHGTGTAGAPPGHRALRVGEAAINKSRPASLPLSLHSCAASSAGSRGQGGAAWPSRVILRYTITRVRPDFDAADARPSIPTQYPRSGEGPTKASCAAVGAPWCTGQAAPREEGDCRQSGPTGVPRAHDSRGNNFEFGAQNFEFKISFFVL